MELEVTMTELKPKTIRIVVETLEGKELELMLRGEKQVALFNQELGIPDAFLPYLELGMLHSKTVQRHINDVCLTDFIVYLPQSLALAEQMEVLLPASTVNGFDPKVEREIGRILGYREKDIEYYIQHFQDNLEKYRQQYS